MLVGTQLSEYGGMERVHRPLNVPLIRETAVWIRLIKMYLNLLPHTELIFLVI